MHDELHMTFITFQKSVEGHVTYWKGKILNDIVITSSVVTTKTDSSNWSSSIEKHSCHSYPVVTERSEPANMWSEVSTISHESAKYPDTWKYEQVYQFGTGSQGINHNSFFV